MEADAADWRWGLVVEASGREACARVRFGAWAVAIHWLWCGGDLG